MEVLQIKNKNKLTSQRMMIEIFIAGLTLILANATYFSFKGNNYTNYFGFDYSIRVLHITLISISSCVFYDVIYSLQILFNFKLKNRFRLFIRSVFSSYSYVTGVLITLLLPVGINIFLIPLVCFISFLFARFLPKGLNKNIFIPAVVACVFTSYFIPSSNYLGSLVGNKYIYDVYANSLFNEVAYPNSFTHFNAYTNYGIWNIIIGDYLSFIGITNALYLLIFIAYFIARKIIDFRTALIYILSFYISSFILYNFDYEVKDALLNSFIYTIASPVPFIAAFLINNFNTTPYYKSGKIVYALFFANMSMLARLFFTNIIWVFIALLFTNLISFILNKVHNKTDRGKTLYIIMSIILISGLFFVPYIYSNYCLSIRFDF